MGAFRFYVSRRRARLSPVKPHADAATGEREFSAIVPDRLRPAQPAEA